jgi:hypothetical protein
MVMRNLIRRILREDLEQKLNKRKRAIMNMGIGKSITLLGLDVVIESLEISKEDLIKDHINDIIKEIGLLKTLDLIGLNLILSTLEITKKELYQKYNPLKFIDENYKKSIEDTIIEKIVDDGWIKRWKGSTEEEIFNFLINVGIDDNHYHLINWDTGDWIVPDTDKVLKLIYGDWLKQHEGYKTLISLIKSK